MRAKKITRIVLGLGFATLGAAGVACSSDGAEPRGVGFDGSIPDVAAPDGGGLPADASTLNDGSGAEHDAELGEAGAADGHPEDAAHDGSAPDAAGPADSSATPDSGIDCGADAVLHPPGDASIFCPFSAPFGQAPLRCAASQECCETSPDAGVLGTCETKGAACPVPSSTRWECQDAVNCPAAQFCCAVGRDGGAVTVDPSGTCGRPFLVNFEGTRCQAACGADGLAVCEAQSSCPVGTCTPLRTRGVELGVCR